MTIRVAINGLGRIGRLFLRASLQRAELPYEIVAINDLAPAATVKHLLMFDSTHGPLAQPLALEQTETRTWLQWQGGSIEMFQLESPSDCPWQSLDIDLVIEATGAFRTRESLTQHLSAGAKRVLLTSPGQDELDLDVIYGINEAQIAPAHRLISNQSCTANALAVMCQPLLQQVGIVKGMMTEIHAYTNDQKLLDSAHTDLRRGRAAAHSMVPTATAGGLVLGKVIPELAGKIQGYSMRVPTLNVAAIDLTLELASPISTEEVKAIYRQHLEREDRCILAINELPLVSCDFLGQRVSAVVDFTQIEVNGNWVKLVAWYDNEWGYVSRLVDLAGYLAR